MPTKEEVRQALRNVLDPEIGKPIEDVGMLKDIVVEGGTVRVYVLLTIAGCPLKDRINDDVTRALKPLPGVERIDVVLGEMTSDQRQELVTQLRGSKPEQQTFFATGDTTVIAVASGKGGVGKSTVTANLATALAAEGHRVGVLDADVWGFSVPRMMGVSGQPVGFNNMILPLEAHGVRIISMGFFVPEDQPVIWRGPMLHRAVQQFLGDVYWGELDFLLCDLPPGTGDVSLSMASFLPGASMLVVTTPQEAARRVAERAGKMAAQVHQRVVGVVENMSWFACAHCGEREFVFGEGGGQEAANTLGVPLLGQVPLYPPLRAGGDACAADHRQQLFPDSMFEDLFPSGRGRPSVPADVMASAMVLQALEGLSDRDAARALTDRISWKVACGLALDEEGFHATALTYWRNRLRTSDRPERVFDAVRAVVEATGVLKHRTRRALDSTLLDDAVATQDTVTQIISAIRRVRREIPASTAVPLAAHDYEAGAKPMIAWDDPVAKQALVSALVGDALALIEALEDSPLSMEQRDAVGLLALVAGQDVESGEDPGTWRIAQKV